MGHNSRPTQSEGFLLSVNEMMEAASLFVGTEAENRFDFPATAWKSYNQQESPIKPIKIDETESPSSSDLKNNLERFLDAIRPSVPAQGFSERSMILSDFQPYFILNDLWETFKEWSSYGIGVPLVLNGGVSVHQYYVPYLSGIQIYGEADDIRQDSKFRLARRDRKSPRDTSSDVCFNPQDDLLFQFLGQGRPHEREPLTNKINDLAKQYPGLKTLRSCDIQATSWFSVAWYPIYRIPAGPSLKNLDASFLTYHNLSTRGRGKAKAKAKTEISLPAFGMSCYKLRNLIWEQTDYENRMAKFLLEEADKWLRRLHVSQPDFDFFADFRDRKR